MGQQLAQKWCSDCHAVGAEDAEAYVPSFVLIAEMCFSIGGLKLVFAQEHGAGLEAWQTRTRRGDSDLRQSWFESAIAFGVIYEASTAPCGSNAFHAPSKRKLAIAPVGNFPPADASSLFKSAWASSSARSCRAGL